MAGPRRPIPSKVVFPRNHALAHALADRPEDNVTGYLHKLEGKLRSAR